MQQYNARISNCNTGLYHGSQCWINTCVYLYIMTVLVNMIDDDSYVVNKLDCLHFVPNYVDLWKLCFQLVSVLTLMVEISALSRYRARYSSFLHWAHDTQKQYYPWAWNWTQELPIYHRVQDTTKIPSCCPRTKKLFMLVWRCHQLLPEFLPKGHLPQVSRHSRLSTNDKGDNYRIPGAV